MESIEFPIIWAVESSANISSFESRIEGRSFVKILKSLGPNKEPWGTPEVSPIFSEFVPLTCRYKLVSIVQIINSPIK